MKIALIVVLALLPAIAYAANCMSYESRPTDKSVQATRQATVDLWNSLPTGASGFCPFTAVDRVENWSNNGKCGGPQGGFAARFRANFVVPTAAVYQFWGGIDFGRGGFISVDGDAFVQLRSSDMWWNGNFNDQSQYLYLSASLQPGNHVLDIIGFEGCCDGPDSLYVTVGGQARQLMVCGQDEANIIADEPIWVNNAPALGAVTDSSVVVTVATDIASTAYCSVLAAGQNQPTAFQLQMADWWPASAHGSVATDSNGAQMTLDGLLCGTDYVLYCYAVSTNGDLMNEGNINDFARSFRTTGSGCFDASCDSGATQGHGCSFTVSSGGKQISIDYSKGNHYHNADYTCQ